MRKKRKKTIGDSIQEPYRTGYKIAANGKWEYEQYWRMTLLEMRRAQPARNRRNRIDALRATVVH
tara:strand:+ start:196 stop:390 length:195 start_codon:yes stop_codon:yes gene_type:complete